MPDTWIVVANAGRARFFSRHNREALEAVDDRVHDAARQRTADTESDALGRRGPSGRSTSPSSGYEPHQTPAEHQSERFAREVAQALAKACDEARFTQLVLVASPEFLGVLRKRLDGRVASVVRREIAKDWTASDAAHLREQIDAHASSG